MNNIFEDARRSFGATHLVSAEGWRPYPHAFYAGSQHNKMIIVDRRVLITGSFNFTNSAAGTYLENCLKIWDPAIVARARDYCNHIRSAYLTRRANAASDPKKGRRLQRVSGLSR